MSAAARQMREALAAFERARLLYETETGHRVVAAASDDGLGLFDEEVLMRALQRIAADAPGSDAVDLVDGGPRIGLLRVAAYQVVFDCEEDP